MTAVCATYLLWRGLSEGRAEGGEFGLPKYEKKDTREQRDSTRWHVPAKK